MQKFLTNNTKAFTSLLAKLHDGVIVHAEDTSIIYANPSASNILGLSEDELLGKSVTNHPWHFIDEDHRKIDTQEYPVCKLFNSCEIIEDQILGIYSSNSTLKWVEINGSITMNENNEKVALMIIRDVTQRKNSYDEAKLFKHLVDTANTGITISDPYQEDNPLIYANKTFTTMTGYSFEESVGKNCRFLQNSDTDQEGIQTIKEAIKNEQSSEVEIRNYTKDNTLFYNLLNISPLFEKNRLKYFIGVQHDVTKQKQQEALLKEKHLYIESILNAQNGIVLVSDHTSIIFANQAFYSFFGVDSLEEFLQESSCICNYFIAHTSYFHLGIVDEKENWIEELNKLPQEKRIVCMNDLQEKRNYFKISIENILENKYVLTLNNISHEIEKELLLSSKAYHDPLTGAYNRQYFYEYILSQTKDKYLSFALIMSDIDNFKSINDTYGHSAGDEVLKALVHTLQISLRPDDSVVRWGGEEFICIVEANSETVANTIAQNLRKAIEKIQIKGMRKFTSSFGVTMILNDENIDVAVQRADTALYKAKSNGKNRVEIS